MFKSTRERSKQNTGDSKFARMFYFLLRKIIGPLVRLIWIRHVEGLKNIPKEGPVIVAFNHSSYFDFICFIAVSPRSVHYLAAEKFFESLLWRPMVQWTGQIKVQRISKDKRVVHDRVFQHLKDGKMIGIFPEGTRSPDGYMLPAFRGVAMYATKARVSIVPVGIKGAYEVMSRFDHFPRFKKIVEINVGEPVSFEKYFHIKLNKKAHQVLTEGIMTKIAELCDCDYPYHTVANQEDDKEKQLVIFDVDNTLLRGQSQRAFASYLFSVGIVGLSEYISMLAWFVFYRLGLISKPDNAMKKFYSLLKGWNIAEVNKIVNIFFESSLKQKFFEESLKILNDHKQHGRRILLISNIPDIIMEKVAYYVGVNDFICTKLERAGNTFTGNIDGEIFYGRRRTFEVREFITQNNLTLEKTWVYADHMSDLPLLTIAKRPTVVNPNRKLANIAEKMGWPVMQFT